MSAIPQSSKVEDLIRRNVKAYHHIILRPLRGAGETMLPCAQESATHIGVFFGNDPDDDSGHVHVVSLSDTAGLKRIIDFCVALNPDMNLVTPDRASSKKYDDGLLKA